MIPAIPSQCLPRAFSSRPLEHLFQTLNLALGLLEVRFERLAQFRGGGCFGQLCQRFRELPFGVIRIPQLVDECVV